MMERENTNMRGEWEMNYKKNEETYVLQVPTLHISFPFDHAGMVVFSYYLISLRLL